MEKFTIKDNTVENFLPISPKAPKFGVFPKEENQMFQSFDYNWIPTNQPNYSSLLSPTLQRSATDYMGVTTFEAPVVLKESLVDISYLDFQKYNFNTLTSSNIESLMSPLYGTGDNAPKIASIFNGLQLIRIPVDVFNDTTADPMVYGYGKYYIKVSPKYIQAPVSTIEGRFHSSSFDLNNPTHLRRRIVRVNKTFFFNKVWNFENQSFAKQSGRLYGSVVEVWNSNLTEKKDVKVIAENNLHLLASDGFSFAELHITPEIVGYEAPGQAIVPGDVLRIYPRESYFNPIYIEVTYEEKGKSLEEAVRYMKNDATRNLKTGVIEVYDDNGITFDSQGNLNGTVIQSYQVSLQGDVEVRKNLNLENE
jgi:hypothetical protein